jgi:hypothetical protein
MRKSNIDLSRRTFLKGTVGSATALAVSGAFSRDLLAQDADYMREGFVFFSPSEVPVVEAFAEQVWPSDGAGIGGSEAGVAVYIDRALAGPYQHYQPAYRTGLDWLDQAANDDHGSGFADLSTEDQTAFLEKYLGLPSTLPATAATPEADSATPVSMDSEAVATPAAQQQDLGTEGMQLPGETITGAAMIAGGDPPQIADLGEFLDIMLTHTIEGLFADPAYGGNRDKEIWRTLQYGGPYYVHTEEHQSTFEPLDIPIQSIADL